jgi:hypothetical protein
MTEQIQKETKRIPYCSNKKLQFDEESVIWARRLGRTSESIDAQTNRIRDYLGYDYESFSDYTGNTLGITHIRPKITIGTTVDLKNPRGTIMRGITDSLEDLSRDTLSKVKMEERDGENSFRGLLDHTFKKDYTPTPEEIEYISQRFSYAASKNQFYEAHGRLTTTIKTLKETK